MKIPFVDLKAQYNSIKSEIDRVISDVIEEGAFVGGRYVKTFEQNFADYVGTKHCIGVGNGTDALFVALKALGVGKGDEVITAANSFIATSEAITMTGARVVFVDCDKNTYNIDVNLIEKSIVKRTKAIVPVHLYGQSADMDGILALAKKNSLFVVEDAAQAHGAKYKDKNVGTFGDCACFSFFPGKNLGAYGDGGAVVTNDDGLAKKIRMFANHGRVEKYNHEFEGINSRLDGLQAAILNVKLSHLDKWNKRRQVIAEVYNEELRDIVVTPFACNGQHVYHLYVIRVKNRDRIKDFLADNGVSTGIHYPVPLPFLKAYAYLGHEPEDFSVSFVCKDQLLSLPIYGDMTDEQVNYVIDQLKQGVQKVGGG